jgi:putative ABC transport system permease protein
MLRHKVQAVVIVAVLFIATASATLGLALLNANNSPFTRAFAAQHGADVTVTANAGRASAAQLAATAHVAGVTAVAGPFDQTTIPLEFQGQPWGQTTLVGRSDPSGPVDDVVLNAGHWASGPGQVVLAGSPASGGGGQVNGGGPALGNTITATSLPGKPVLTIVGFANSVTDSTDGGGWVTPGELSSLRAPGSQPTAQLLFRFTNSATNAQLKADMAAVTKALPAGTVIDWGSWLTAQQSHGSNAAIMEPFVMAFALIGLVMAVLIVGNVISGAVIAQYQRIGVLKSLGLTPAQVVAVYLSRVGWPAVAGCLVGVVGGYLLSVPVLHQSAGAYDVGSQQVPLWALLLAPAGMLAITLLAALGPALRAGRLSAIEAIASGRAPATGRGYAVHRLAARLNLPRPVGLGLAAPFARPARTLVTLAAIAFGATAVIFAVGLHSSLSDARAAQTLSATVPVQVQQNTGPNQVPTAAQFAAATTAINAQPGTAHSNAEYGTQVNVVGFSQGVQTTVFDGPSSWMGYALISGHWYDAPGEVDVNTSFLTDSGLAVGDTTTVYTGSVTAGAKPVTVRIAGEIFDPGNQPRMYTSAQTLPVTAVPDNFWQWNVGLKPGTTAAAYSQAVNAELGANSPFMAGPSNSGGQFYVIAIGLIGLLSLMVAIAAGLGVLNTVLMTTRDRVHDLGIFKSLGMRPGQVVVMVICWVVGPAVIAGAIAAPAAVALNTATLHAMAATSHTGVPASFTDVFPVSRLALLSLAALAIAVIGALLPATWAARTRPATALRAE